MQRADDRLQLGGRVVVERLGVADGRQHAGMIRTDMGEQGAFEAGDGRDRDLVEEAVHAGYPVDAGSILLVELDGPRAEVTGLGTGHEAPRAGGPLLQCQRRQ